MFAPITFVDLHTTLFLGGRNLGQKLDPKKIQGLIISYDTETERLWVEFNGYACFIGVEGAVHPEEPKDFGYVVTTKTTVTGPVVSKVDHPMVANVSRTAQVETPMSKPPTQPSKITKTKYQGM